MLPPGEKQKNITVSTDPEPKLKTGTVISSTKEIVLNPAQEFKVITPKSECITTDKPEAEAALFPQGQHVPDSLRSFA